MKWLRLLTAVLAASAVFTGAAFPGAAQTSSVKPETFDVVVYEATPGGIAAAIQAARLGHSVALVEWQNHIGGMMTSGLGKSDIETRAAIGGLFKEYVDRVYAFYVAKYGANSENAKLSREGYYYEPSVAEHILTEMIQAEPRIQLRTGWRLADSTHAKDRLTAIRVKNLATNATEELHAKVFIDGSYEGDLAASAGAAYRVGREARSETDELDAGVVYMDYETRAFLPGTTGEGDKRIPAYTYRLCLTDDPANSTILKEPPPGYDRTVYLGYLEDWKAGRLGPPKTMKEGVGYFAPTFNTVVRALSMAELPNHKYDVNMNPRPLGFPFSEVNYNYPDADWTQRDAISMKLRNMTLGLLYFVQNDSEVPQAQRELARRYNLAKDEFTDNGNFPWQLYVREARRLVGTYTLTEQDLLVGPALGRTRVHADSISAGEFPIDSYPVRSHEPGHDVALEGYIFMLDQLTHPYQIPYGVIVPAKIDGLLVPVAASATHIAFATIRLEPTWMALGQAAGTAADVAIRSGREPRAIQVTVMQRQLLKSGQLLTYFKDVDHNDPAYAALQYFGTRGFFKDYYARSHDPVTQQDAHDWLALAYPTAPRSILAPFHGAGPVTYAQLKSALEAAHISVNANQESGGSLTRGELCRLLYDSLGPRSSFSN